MNRLTKTKTGFTTLILAFILISSSTVFTKTLQAQDEDRGFLLSTTEFTIKPGHNNQFRQGVKAWKACYLENEGNWKWNMWSRVNGEGNVYYLASTMGSWAEMDQRDESAMKCRDIGRDMINPHVKSAERNMNRFMPAVSNTYPNTDTVLWVNYFRVNNFSEFNEIVKDVNNVIQSEEGKSRGFWYDVLGGAADVPHYFVATPFANFAALDEERESVWKVYERVEGEKKTEETRDRFREAVESNWSYILRNDVELSNPRTAE